jgi:phosphate transport system substrate-binding protein
MWRLTLLAAADKTNNQTPRHPPAEQGVENKLTVNGPARLGRACLADAASIFGQTRRNPVRFIHSIVAAGLASAALIAPASALDISGAGATFPYPVYAKWADTYKKETGIGLNYQSIGSGGGIKQIKAKTVTFGASDAPLSGKELAESGLVQFPMVMGGIVPVLNVEGIKPGDLVIDGPALAKIFLGEIKSWDDPALQKLNPNAKLPKQAIVIVHRSDGSGTTFNFTYYLSEVSADWKSKVGTNTAVEWPAGIGAKGNEGVANNVANTKGSIGYVEYAYAKQNKLTFTKMINKDGKTVAPTSATFQAAAANAKWDSQPGYGVILANQPGAESWPMTAATWILIHARPPDPVAAAEALKFFSWAYDKGAKMAEELDYVPMPAQVVASVKKTWASEIKDASGKPLYGMSN